MRTIRVARVVVAIATCMISGTARSQGRIVGTVFDSLFTAAPLKGATVSLLGTPHVATADDHGRFRFDSVDPGRHQLTFFHPELDSLGLAAGVSDIDVPAAGEVRVTLTTPATGSMLTRLCPGPRTPMTGVVVGRARDVDTGAPLDHAVVFTAWVELVPEGKSLTSQVRRVAAPTSANGVFALCGVPTDVPVMIHAQQDGQVSGAVEVYLQHRDVAFQHLALSVRDSAAGIIYDSLADQSNGGADTRPWGSARLVGHVRDQNGRLVRGARLAIVGMRDSAFANDSGRFVIDRVPAGSRTLEVHAIGYAPSRHVVDLLSGTTTNAVITIDPRLVVLPKVSVIGASAFTRRTGFAERQRIGNGYFLDPDKIERMSGATALDVLWSAPGVFPRMIKMHGRWVRTIVMSGTPGLNSNRTCIPNLFIDGVWQTRSELDAWDGLNSFFTKDQVEAVEVYTSFGVIPPQFDKANNCGSVVVWTRN